VIRVEIGDEEQVRLDTLADQPDRPYLFRTATSEELICSFDGVVLEIARNALNELESGDPALTQAMTRRLAVLQAKPVGRMLT
jgi:hypothetical protein